MCCILRTSQFKQVVIKKVINIRCRGNCVLLLLSPELGTSPTVRDVSLPDILSPPSRAG